MDTSAKQKQQRILHVPRRFVREEWGGTETVLQELSRCQQRQGYRPEIFTSLALSNRNTDEIGGIPVRRFPHFYTYLALPAEARTNLDKKGGNLFSLQLLTALSRAPHVRLFHAHGINRLGGIVRTAARRQGKPFVVTLHGNVFDVPAAERASLRAPTQDRWDWGKPLGWLVGSRHVLRDADQIICVGYSEYLKAQEAIPPDRLAYLPNGVDPNRFVNANGPDFRARLGIPSDAFVMGNISRIDSQKNQHVLLEAFAKVHRQDPRSHLILIGPETQTAYGKRLRETIASHQLQHAVHILPGLDHDDPDLPAAYHACDLFVLPSVHEPFGIVVLEAWCARLPVIASRIGGLRNLIREGETGLSFDPLGDEPAEALASKIHALKQDRAYASQLASTGYREVHRHYTWDRVGARLESIYREAEQAAAART